jgi:hypothetical protein
MSIYSKKSHSKKSHSKKSHSKKSHSKKSHLKKTIKKVRFSKKNNKTRKPKIKIIKRKKTPYMKGGNLLETFFPKDFNQVVPFLPPQNTYIPLSNDMHGINNILENSGNIPVYQGGAMTDFIPNDITNLGRNVVTGIKGVYSGFVGQNMPASSYPNVTYQPALEKPVDLDIQPVDINEIYNSSDLKVATL